MKLLILLFLFPLSLFAKGNLEHVPSSSGGKVVFNTSQSPQNTLLKFTPSGQPYLTSNKTISVSGAKSPITLAIKQDLPKPTASKAIVRLLKAATPIGTAVAVGSELMNLFNEYKFSNPRMESDSQGNPVLKYEENTPNKKCRIAYDGNAPIYCDQVPHPYKIVPSSPYDICYENAPVNGYETIRGYCIQYDEVGGTDNFRQKTMQELEDYIASESGWPSSSTTVNGITRNPPTENSPLGKLVKEVLNHPSIEFEQPETKPVLTGPSTVQGATTTSSATLPSGATQTTTSTTTYNITYQGDTYNIQKITNNTYNDGQTTTQQTTTDDQLPEKPEEEKEDKETSFNGACDSIPTCSGDSILCAIATSSFAAKCQLEDMNSKNDFAKQQAENAFNDTDPFSTTQAKANPQIVNVQTSLNTDGFNWSRSCPENPSFELPFAGTFQIPFDKLCSPIQIMSDLAVAITLIGSMIFLLPKS